MSGHTPGPWSFFEERGPKNELCFHSIRNADGKYLSSTWGGPHISNARLIASAPTMHEMILNFCKESEWAADIWKNQAHIKPLFDYASIAKATGKDKP